MARAPLRPQRAQKRHRDTETSPRALSALLWNIYMICGLVSLPGLAKSAEMNDGETVPLKPRVLIICEFR